MNEDRERRAALRDRCVGLRLERAELQALDAFAREQGVTRSAAIREILAEHLEVSRRRAVVHRLDDYRRLSAGGPDSGPTFSRSANR